MGYKAGLWSCHTGGPHWRLVLSKPAKRHLGIKKSRRWHECLVGTSLHELVSQVDKPQSQRQCTVKGITSFCSPPSLAHWCGAGWPSSGDPLPSLRPHSVTLLLEDAKSFFNLSASSPEAFRASFRFSYSLQSSHEKRGQNSTP